jgi:CubicO group peptidase (beta-lactamase class C family)
VIVDGEAVVDLWGGTADPAGTRPWTADTLVNVWSTTKGWLALAMHMLVERGLLDLDAPVARYWPAFAGNGKGRVLVRHVLTHTAGLPGFSMKVPDESIYDWDAMIRCLEQSALLWEPGTKCGYHAGTFGWLNGEMLRRITSVSFGEFLRTQIALPLGADVFVGLSDQETPRTADAIPPSFLGEALFRFSVATGGKAKYLAFRNPQRPPKAANTRRWREAQIPSSNGHASARGLARLYTPLALGGTAGGVRLLSEANVVRASREQVHQTDVVIGFPVRRSLGFMLADPERGDPRPAGAFGHPGMGGSVGFADPSRRLAMWYVMNRMIVGLDTRAPSLCRAVYACVKR